jgi:hypothetical protein
MKTTKCPESLCPVLRYLHWRGVSHLLGGRCPSLIAPTDSCAKPAWLSPPSVFSLVRGVFAGRYQPLLPTGSSRRYLCESFLGCLIPYPGGSTKCFYLFLLLWHRPSPKKETGRLPQFLANTTFREAGFRGCRYFFMFRPPSLLVSQIVPTAAILPQGSRDFYFRAERASLPPHAPDMLTVRIQAIDGTRTFTLLDSQPCRLLIPLPCLDEGFANLFRSLPSSYLFTSFRRVCSVVARQFKVGVGWPVPLNETNERLAERPAIPRLLHEEFLVSD